MERLDLTMIGEGMEGEVCCTTSAENDMRGQHRPHGRSATLRYSSINYPVERGDACNTVLNAPVSPRIYSANRVTEVSSTVPRQ